MKTVVITGSTRGIGFAMANAFIERGFNAVISGRKQASVKRAIEALSKSGSDGTVIGTACNVNSYDDIQGLWDFAIGKFGSVDIWINNAGISNELRMIEDIPYAEMQRVVETNILGEMYGSRIALSGFKKQGHGALYNMEGMGSKKSRMVDGLSIYGTTKAGLRYFNDAIAHENKNPNIIVGALLPGMVLTDMVTGQYIDKPEEWKRVQRIFSAISEDVDVVAEWLVEKMVANQKNGIRFSFSNPIKISLRMLKVMFGNKQ